VKCKNVYLGTTVKEGEWKMSNRIPHIKLPKGNLNQGVLIVNMVIKSKRFKDMCKLPVRLVSPWDKDSMRDEKDKMLNIKQAHDHWVDHIGWAATNDIHLLDRPSRDFANTSNKKLTLCQMIFLMKWEEDKESLFYLIDEEEGELG
jgi:hypothetical protein